MEMETLGSPLIMPKNLPGTDHLCATSNNLVSASRDYLQWLYPKLAEIYI